MCDFIAAWNAKVGKGSIDLSGLDESAEAIERKMKEDGRN